MFYFISDFPRVNVLYLFGAVVFVLVNSAGLMTELILQAGDEMIYLWIRIERE